MWPFSMWRHHLQNEANRRVIRTLPSRHDQVTEKLQGQAADRAVRKSQTGKRLSKYERKALHARVMRNYHNS